MIDIFIILIYTLFHIVYRTMNDFESVGTNSHRSPAQPESPGGWAECRAIKALRASLALRRRSGIDTRQRLLGRAHGTDALALPLFAAALPSFAGILNVPAAGLKLRVN
jgi:hypothetical protein